MHILVFLCINPQGESQDCMFGGPDLESCFKALNEMVERGWQLLTIELIDSAGISIHLPIGAFDGKSMDEPLSHLKQEWESLLGTR